MAARETPDPTPVLAIRDYTLAYATPSGVADALTDINLDIDEGQVQGLVGESGSGKTSLAWAILRYLPGNAVERGGDIALRGESLLPRTGSEILEIRGRRISMVFQDPGTALNPVLRLGEQISEVLVRHRGLTPRQARAEGEAMLARTGIARPRDMMDRYPHEASGGEKQRVTIATALACNPEMIIFDEPTTALDILTAHQILDLFERLRAETRMTALYISHDLGLVSRIADEVAVIHAGRIVEQGTRQAIFGAPARDYTRTLLAAVPDPDRRIGPPRAQVEREPVLATEGLGVRYGGRSELLRLLAPRREVVRGARDVSLAVEPGEIFGVVGESGSGKSTLARALAGLQEFEGAIRFRDRKLRRRREFERSYRREVQIVFQHPDASLNPRQRIGTILSRPLRLYGLARRGELAAEVRRLLEQVLLPADFADRYPHELSGGEKQRVAIARAFAARPSLVICDEITSSLDVSVQAAIAELLVGLQGSSGTACLFITHDLNLVRQLAHRIAVMRNGALVDLFPTEEAEHPDRHPYTQALLAAVPPPAHTLRRENAS